MVENKEGKKGEEEEIEPKFVGSSLECRLPYDYTIVDVGK